MLLTGAAEATGLTAGLLAAWRKPLATHDPGKVASDLALSLALGGDCLADPGLLRAEPGLGNVASEATVSRTLTTLAGDADAALRAINRRGQLADLEVRHRRRARAEDRIRIAKDTGLANLPLHGFDANRIWCQLVLLAMELTARTHLLAFTGHAARRWGTQTGSSQLRWGS
ncbi:Transposase DDE domain group 1 [Ornithinimicrobium cerasi]|uniref:Transposase DDE domain group 1 n=1 Tax=Ornithinimicrobium cerasi TaxID=2248773 RepID=A0A285VNX6_9MICO|nr:Transposase DDE domain group 1 [Ornithinimicrobium cerasi]